MSARTNREIVGVFLVLPPLAGLGLIVALVLNAVRHAAQFGFMDWLWQVGGPGVLAIGLMTALPAAGWQELRLRRMRPGPSGGPNTPSAG